MSENKIFAHQRHKKTDYVAKDAKDVIYKKMLYAGAKDTFSHIQAPTTSKARHDMSKDIKRSQKTSYIKFGYVTKTEYAGAKDIFKRLRHKKNQRHKKTDYVAKDTKRRNI